MEWQIRLIPKCSGKINLKNIYADTKRWQRVVYG